MVDVKIETFENLSPQLERQTDDLRFVAFRKDLLTEEQKAESNEKFTFKEDIFKYVIAFLGEKPVGYIRLFRRNINLKGRKVVLGGIGGVCTDPQEQRKGIATKMLQVAVKKLKKANCDIAYLCTNIPKLENLYGQVGFVPLSRPYTFVGKSGKKHIDDDGMIAPINSQKTFQEILEDTDPFDLEGMNW